MSTKIYDAYTMNTKSLGVTAKWLDSLRNGLFGHIRQDLAMPSICNVVSDLTQGVLYCRAAGQYPKARTKVLYWYNRIRKSFNQKELGNISRVAASRIWQYMMSTVLFWYQDMCEDTPDSADRRFIRVPDAATVILYPDGKQTRLLAFGKELTWFLRQYKDWYELSDFHYQDQGDRPENIPAKEWSARRKAWEKLIGPDYVPANHGMEVALFRPEQLGAKVLIPHYNDMCIFFSDILEMLGSDVYRENLLEQTCEDFAFEDMLHRKFCREYMAQHPECQEEELPIGAFRQEFRREKDIPGSKAAKKVASYREKLRPYMLDYRKDAFRQYFLQGNTEAASLNRLLFLPLETVKDLFC